MIPIALALTEVGPIDSFARFPSHLFSGILPNAAFVVLEDPNRSYGVSECFPRRLKEASAILTSSTTHVHPNFALSTLIALVY